MTSRHLHQEESPPANNGSSASRSTSTSTSNEQPETPQDAPSEAQVEQFVREAKQRFRDTLPKGYLTPQEYRLYERLFGAPLRETEPEDVGIHTHQDVQGDVRRGNPEEELRSLRSLRRDIGSVATILPTRTALGDEEVALRERKPHDMVQEEQEQEDQAGVEDGAAETLQTTYDPDNDGEETRMRPGEEYVRLIARNPREYEALQKLRARYEEEQKEQKAREEELKVERIRLDMKQAEEEAAQEDAMAEPMEEAQEEEEEEEDEIVEEEERQDEEEKKHEEEEQRDEEEEEENEEDEKEAREYELLRGQHQPGRPRGHRYHPYTLEGHARTNPATIELPRYRFLDPITKLLRRTDVKHVKLAAESGFGGPGLPLSPATPRGLRNGRMEEVGLRAAQRHMTEIESDAFLAGFMPTAFVSATGVLAEVRRRLGTAWLRGLLLRNTGPAEGGTRGPAVLDVGSAGSALAAWREIVEAEWAVMTNEEKGEERRLNPPTRGTVVVGSDTLRGRVSQFLTNTQFLPRLPDYLHVDGPQSLDGPADGAAMPRHKVFDVVVASHSLLPIEEGHRRRAVLNNLWEMLSPEGGVLVVIERANPRGFEAVAEVRAQLLRDYIIAPPSAAPATAQSVDPASHGNDRGERVRERGLIVAPCTNHDRCPMYRIPGRTHGRRDFCHFSQRFVLPPFLSAITGRTDGNDSSVEFSYVVVQRGGTAAQARVEHGQIATERAFRGYGGDGDGDSTIAPGPPPDMLSLPRLIQPPLKNQGHVILDVCTPDAKMQRWTVPRSFGRQAYRDARKSRWGDLWALGAKTRVDREPRLGRNRATPGRQDMTKKGKAPAPLRRTKGGKKRRVILDGGPTGGVGGGGDEEAYIEMHE